MKTWHAMHIPFALFLLQTADIESAGMVGGAAA